VLPNEERGMGESGRPAKITNKSETKRNKGEVASGDTMNATVNKPTGSAKEDGSVIESTPPLNKKGGLRAGGRGVSERTAAHKSRTKQEKMKPIHNICTVHTEMARGKKRGRRSAGVTLSCGVRRISVIERKQPPPLGGR